MTTTTETPWMLKNVADTALVRWQRDPVGVWTRCCMCGAGIKVFVDLDANPPRPIPPPEDGAV